MIGKLVTIVLLLAVAVFFISFLYDNLPGSPEILSIEEKEVSSFQIPISNVAVFLLNLRFPSNEISYSIDSSCSLNSIKRIKQAFEILENKTNLLEFYEKSGGDILIGCSEDYLKLDENLFIAGEGGPSEIINTSLFNVILKGKVSLYKRSDCNYPVVEIHELLHVLGLDHSKNPNDIMYNVSECSQRINPEVINTLIRLYSVQSLPDLYIENVSGLKKGKYLDFNITVKNQGLKDAENISLEIFSNNEKIDKYNLEDIKIGAGRVLSVQNAKLLLRTANEIKFRVNYEKTIQELNYENNEAVLVSE